ncbi:hypothetical protein WG66_013687 [Moniliophthora roreri]|nr:hypothetical protein WG66_013687 [Moniliophthora roreri]
MIYHALYDPAVQKEPLPLRLSAGVGERFDFKRPCQTRQDCERKTQAFRVAAWLYNGPDVLHCSCACQTG